MKKVIKSLSSVLMSVVVLVVSISTLPAYAATTVKLPNYPVYYQFSNDCWAYAILSMTNYMYGGGYNLDDMFNIYKTATGKEYKYDDGANDNECLKVMKHIFSEYSPVKKGELTSNEIKMEINSDFPVFISGTDWNNFSSHAVALMGYRVDDKGM